MSEKRFVVHDSSVEEYVESLENKNTQGKTKGDVKLLNDFLRGEKKEERELSAITPEDLDRYLAEFIRSVRRKDGGEYEPSSLRSLLASVERYLKKNSYPASVFSDRQFELTRRCLQPKQKELNLSMYITNIIPHGKCFVRCLHTRCFVSEISLARFAHLFEF